MIGGERDRMEVVRGHSIGVVWHWRHDGGFKTNGDHWPGQGQIESVRKDPGQLLWAGTQHKAVILIVWKSSQ